jgi:hypothetical protein
VVTFDYFQNKLTISVLFAIQSTLFLPKVTKNRVNNNFKPVASFTMGQKFDSLINWILFYEIKLQKFKTH